MSDTSGYQYQGKAYKRVTPHNRRTLIRLQLRLANCSRSPGPIMIERIQGNTRTHNASSTTGEHRIFHKAEANRTGRLRESILKPTRCRRRLLALSRRADFA